MFDFYLRHEWWFAAVQLALAMFGMGVTLRLRDFIAVFRTPRAFVVGCVVQVVGIPLLAILWNGLADPAAGIAFGLVIVAAMPGGAMSNVVTYFARGSVALSIALTAVVTLASMATTPLVLRLLAAEFVRADFQMPVQRIAFDIAACLLVPLALGMSIGTPLGSRTRSVVANWCVRGSLVVVAGIAIGSAGAGRLDLSAHSGGTLLTIISFAVALQLAGTLSGWLFGLSRAEIAAVAIETSIRNTNLALLLKASLFPVAVGVADPLADGVLFTALAYGGLAAPLTIPLVLAHRWLARQARSRGRRDRSTPVGGDR